jgi:hypothetical protein
MVLSRFLLRVAAAERNARAAVIAAAVILWAGVAVNSIIYMTLRETGKQGFQY